MKYYLIAGEASGDLHGSNLMKSLRVSDSDAEFRYYGGDLMQAQGGCLVRHYRDTAVMGFVRVVTHAKTILKNIQQCKEDIKRYQPDAVILIDYPGFNLQIAKYVKEKLSIPTFYYIPPKIWAWKTSRVKLIRKYIDRVYAIFPFEPDFYAKYSCEAVYVGNPTVESVSNAQTCSIADFLHRNSLPDKKIIALLPGSRKQEVGLTISVLNEIDFTQFEGYQCIMAATSAVDTQMYQPATKSGIRVIYDQTYDLLANASVAIVNSGTATLETALFNVPQIVCYPIRIPRVLYYFGRKYLIKIPYISLVNIIANKQVVKELVAYQFSAKNTISELKTIIQNDEYRNLMISDYRQISSNLGSSVASDVASNDIISTIKKQSLQ
ncbi:MAG: lipid-A-disaccharide synthase [Bacteroidia bacterium]|nr:lipid-A-disaccharide synthase [Bacteroidia bacterium]